MPTHRRTRSELTFLACLALSILVVRTAHAATPFVHERVDQVGNVGYYPSLVLDNQGNPHIAYYDNTLFDLKYASLKDGTWTIETVDGTGFMGQYCSLALDAQGNPRISYLDN